MRRFVAVAVAVVAAWLHTLVSGGLPPRGHPLPNAELMEQIIHLGLFPDKPRNMSFLQYFRNLTDLNENLTKVLERLELNVLDSENLENVIKLAEDARRLKDMKMFTPGPRGMNMSSEPEAKRRLNFPPSDIFIYKQFPYAWSLERRQKIFQFMQHSVYSTKYEISKLRNLRKRYRNSTVFQIGLLYGNQLELRTTAGALYSTMEKMPLNVTMLWYVFHYHKLLNIAYDVSSNTEIIYLLNERLKDGIEHEAQFNKHWDQLGEYTPWGPDEVTSQDPENLYKKKK